MGVWVGGYHQESISCYSMVVWSCIGSIEVILSDQHTTVVGPSENLKIVCFLVCIDFVDNVKILPSPQQEDASVLQQ